nr:helix-turn-helix transcriptional regulator [Lachnospiraceae bacterium]
MSSFGERLQYLRTTHELAQSELADILQISKSTISMYENNKREPDFLTLGKIADFFRVDMNFLLGHISTNTCLSASSLSEDSQVLVDFLLTHPEHTMLLESLIHVDTRDIPLLRQLLNRFRQSESALPPHDASPFDGAVSDSPPYQK